MINALHYNIDENSVLTWQEDYIHYADSVDSQISNLTNTVVNYTVEVVAESFISTYDW